MGTVSPSPDSAPAAISPASSLTRPQLSTPPQASTQLDPSTPPQGSAPPPSVPSTQVTQQLDANPPDSSAPSPPSSLPDAPAPSGSGTPVIASPVDSSLPPTASVPPSSPSTFPPPTLVSPPPSSDVSPPSPQTGPPVSSPPATKSPPPLPSPDPPTSSAPLAVPPASFPPPPPAGPPPITSPTPPSSTPPSTPTPAPPAFETPEVSPPPPPSKPPENSPPSSSVGPPRRSPPAPASHAPQSSPSAPAVETPSTSQPSTSGPPPPGSVSGSPPAAPATPSPPVSHSSPPSSFGPPLSDPQRAAQSSPNLRAQDSSSAKGNSNGGSSSGGAAAIAIVAAVLVLGLIGFIAVWIIKRKKRKSGANDAYIMPASLGSSPGSDVKLFVKTEYPSPPFGGGSTSDPPTDPGGFGRSKPWFTYEELFEATGGFSSHNLLGEGGFGCVYKGLLADGREVAVKQLKIGGGQGEREFQAEVEIIGRIHHRHLVSLVGYCISKSKRLLVYDYVPNNTLYLHLHGEGRLAIDWSARVKIAAGAARGIAYLHEDCHPRVIHRDIKSSNILLDNNFEARVADFGLAKLAMDADTHVSTRVMGTFGYMAPEYATSGKLTEKSDVYSFGVVLLELITGRKPVDESQPLGDESLVEWARPLLTHALDTGEYEGLVDPRLERNYIESEMFRMIEAAAACVRHSSSKRPRMGQVVRALDGISDSGDLSNGLRVGESRLYDPAQQSAEIRWFRRVAFGSQDISSEFINQSHSYSAQGGHSNNFSGQHGLSGDISEQRDQTYQNLGFSRQDKQNANISADGISTPQHNSVFSDQDRRKSEFF